MCLMQFAARLNDLMELEGVSQRALSIQLKVDRKCIRCWMNGQYFPKYDVLIKLATYFKVSVDYLVGLEDHMEIIEYSALEGNIEKPFDRLHIMISEYIKAQNITEYALAKRSGIDPKALKKWLIQNSKPEVDSIIKLADVMGMSMQELLIGNQKKV